MSAGLVEDTQRIVDRTNTTLSAEFDHDQCIGFDHENRSNDTVRLDMFHFSPFDSSDRWHEFYNRDQFHPWLNHGW